MVWLFAIGAVFGGATHSGIDPADLPLLGGVLHVAPEYGWSASIPDGRPGTVRFFVGHTPDDAIAWFDGLAQNLTKSQAIPLAVEQATGDPWGLVLWRDGNIGGRIERPDGGALDLAERMVAAIVDGEPWPAVFDLTVVGGEAEVSGEWASVRFFVPPKSDPTTFLPKPSTVIYTGPQKAIVGGAEQVRAVGWDRFGRGHTVYWPAAPEPPKEPPLAIPVGNGEGSSPIHK
ncbi:MAG: hypothetical protein HN348_13160 [Proteobacteria bacterium]|jgi:hypothetical protein|nr:hypothetical protein [Pseudomonadota bacterium]